MTSRGRRRDRDGAGPAGGSTPGRGVRELERRGGLQRTGLRDVPGWRRWCRRGALPGAQRQPAVVPGGGVRVAGADEVLHGLPPGEVLAARGVGEGGLGAAGAVGHGRELRGSGPGPQRAQVPRELDDRPAVRVEVTLRSGHRRGPPGHAWRGRIGHRQGPNLAPEGSSAVPRGRYAFGEWPLPRSVARSRAARPPVAPTAAGGSAGVAPGVHTWSVPGATAIRTTAGRRSIPPSGTAYRRISSGAGGAAGPWTRATVGAVHDASSSIRGVTRAEGRSRPVVSQPLCGVRRPA